MDGYRYLTEIFKALGHPVRLQIIEALAQEEEACVCHLERSLGIRQASLSQHLAKLREAGLVVDNRDGTNVYYALTDVSVSQLHQISRTTAQLLALAASEDLVFESPRGDLGEDCRCPRCEAVQTGEPVV
jgi:DNA-binding transcriptional ArsR family regulator